MFAYCSAILTLISLFVFCLPIISGGRTSWGEAAPFVVFLGVALVVDWIAFVRSGRASWRRNIVAITRSALILCCGITAIAALVTLSSHFEILDREGFGLTQDIRAEIRYYQTVRSAGLVLLLCSIAATGYAFAKVRGTPKGDADYAT